MSILAPNVDYTQKDFTALKLRLQGLIRSVFPNWTDFNRANFGNILVELHAFVGDILTFYQDKQARDLYWPTVTQRVNAIRLGRLINFQLSSATSSTGSCRFSVPSAVTGTAKSIPWGTRVRTSGTAPIYFRTTESGKSIAVGSTYVDVAVEQAIAIGSRDPVTLVISGGESFISSGGPNQKYTTLQSPVLDDSIDVEAEDGTYVEVDSFLDNDPTTGEAIDENSKVFAVVKDADDRAILIFGNGIAGKIPESTVNVIYKIGGGAGGNVEAGQISIIDSSDNTLYGISVTNPAATSGGTDRMTVLEARSRGPKSLRVLERCVTKEDFEIAAQEVPGVARAVMVTSNEDSTVQENTGVLCVVALGAKLSSNRIAPATPSATLLAQVLEKVTVEKPPMLTFTPTVEAAPFQTINISTRVYLSSGTNSTTVATAIRNNLKDFFAVKLEDGTDNSTIDFGANIKQADGTIISEIAWSDIFNVINDTDGVRRVDEGSSGLLLNSLRQSVSISARQLPVIGSIAIYDCDAAASI